MPYNEARGVMLSRTLHIFPSDAGWQVKKIFATKREAVATAVGQAKKAGRAQIAIWRDGRMVEHRRYGMPRIQRLPFKSIVGDAKIAKAVDRVVWADLMAAP
jgi:hypothetical protein